ncbi:DUF4282 domain-containing protein [Acinetobacter sp. V91_7]|uniref:DUF4282 domain-containing protein n=1 Tax=unclassified Acinetobacter TaxID=196816 RepID=UPI00287CFB84|nr:MULTISPECIES: DUF4282 domain-containing protein [unclassified Acinetobacter]MDS7935672.1 DUF4282 domain-containing protein [Acinetobacter sp. V91_4B]MDS7964720.1 DUF4282 domain-containing protein [Acinetobacter sp. V91_7]MDS8025585.1 DUF4282 domain-containing protein [Acinetobacter sp. V91_13]
MKNFLFLDSVLSTKIVTLVYWLMLLCVWIPGLGLVIMGFSGTGTYNGASGILMGSGLLIFGTIIARLWSELWVVIFKIQQNTRQIALLLQELKDRNIL